MSGIFKRLTFADGVVVADPPDIADMIGASMVYDVEFDNESSRDIDVGADGFNAETCMVEVRDSGNGYANDAIAYHAVDENTLRLTAGRSITATFSVTVIR